MFFFHLKMCMHYISVTNTNIFTVLMQETPTHSYEDDSKHLI